MSLEQLLLSKEALLLNPAIRGDDQALDEILASDFHEIGSSGKRYDREGCIAALLADPNPSDQIEMLNTTFQCLADEVVLLTYDAQGIHSAGIVRRTSIWRKNGSIWQLAFHQGTRL